MIKFKPLSLENRDLLLKYLKNYSFKTYEYSFLTLYLWRKYCNVEYAIFQDGLLLKKNEEKIGSFFMQPLGFPKETLPDVIQELNQLKQEDMAFKYLFRDIEEPFLNQLQEIYGIDVLYLEDTKDFDYIYETEKLINLPGTKLHKRKNLYNQFIKAYQFEIKDIHDQLVLEDCLDFSRTWFENQSVKTKQITCELEGIREVLTHLELLNAMGMAVYVDHKIVGFTIGEKVNSQMGVIHIEKGDTRYKGIYAFINRTFAKRYLSDTMYINREEDLGIEGLRKAKLAYDPIKLEKKFIIQSIYSEADAQKKFVARG
ncbi:DUF2156 domain-containing protein [Desulfitobacterium sp.]|uniref:DUF2156 domain-containing protein n=1 Tax=Desulfitobacterium sp. TaxID=49981 RepID=UPI002C5ECC04|nr:DUF2156 domain-containing protein [Desulfitobacterium sp.]HVJ49154.1 DUF2156 domain-containing protein [Desulfitobacterium sp.]